MKVARFPLTWSTVGVAGDRLTGSCRERPGNWRPYDAVYHRLTRRRRKSAGLLGSADGAIRSDGGARAVLRSATRDGKD